MLINKKYILIVFLYICKSAFGRQTDFDFQNEITMNATRELALINSHIRNEEILSRQISLPSFPNLSNPLSGLSSRLPRIPCKCDKGVCKCCTGAPLSIIGINGCMEIIYFPEDFAFELKMRMNNLVLYRNRVSGKNPPPICFRPPRYNYARACITFYDVYFLGRNMHVCMDIGGYFQGYELFSRSYDCLLFGNKGIKIVKPEQGYPVRPTDVEVDDDDEEIEDYDENVVRSFKDNFSNSKLIQNLK